MRGLIVLFVTITCCCAATTTLPRGGWRRKVIRFAEEDKAALTVPILAREARKYRDGTAVAADAPMGLDAGGASLNSVASVGGGDKGGDGGQKSKKKTDMMSKILPFMVMPFLVSSSLIPMVLTSLKLMLLKSMFVGKVAIFLIALNFLWRSENKGGVYSHNVNIEHDQKDLHQAHYGFNGDEEYGAYAPRRRSGRFR